MESPVHHFSSSLLSNMAKDLRESARWDRKNERDHLKHATSLRDQYLEKEATAFFYERSAAILDDIDRLNGSRTEVAGEEIGPEA